MIPERIAPGIFFAQEHDMADENLNDAPEENANSNAPSENAQQALDDLTVLSDVGNQSLGESRLNLVRNVDVSDAAMGGLATIHQGSGSGNQVQDGLQVQAGLIQTEEIVVEQAPPAPVELPEVAPIDTEEADPAAEIIDTSVNMEVQEDLSAQNIVFGEGIEIVEEDEVEAVVDEAALEVVTEEVVEVVPDAVLEETFVDSQPTIGGILIDIPGDNDPSLVPVPTPIDWTEDQNLTFGVDASDPDGGTVVINFSEPANGVIIVNGDGTYEYRPDADYFGTDSFTVFVTDDEGNMVSQTVELNIANVDDAAVVSVTGGVGDESTTSGATTVTGSISATDVDGAIIGYEVVAGDHPGILTVNADGTFTFVADNPNWNGSETFTVKVYDDQGGATEVPVTITVNATDDAVIDNGILIDLPGDNDPTLVAVPNPVDMQEDTSLRFAIDATDPDGSPVTISFAQPAHGSVVDNGDGTFTYQPSENYFGSDTVTYTVTSADGSTLTNTMNLNVANVDDAPQVTLVGGSGDEDTVITGSIGVTDVDNQGAASTLELVGDAQHGAVTLNSDGTYSFVAADANWNGTDSFTVRITDAQGTVTEQVVEVNVGAVDDATVVTGPVDLSDVAEDSGAITINASDLLANASDVDNALSVDNVKINGVELVDNGDGTYSYTPPADFNGTIDVSYDVVTDTGIATPATASIDVTAVEDTARLDSPTEVDMTVGQDGVGRGDLDASDPDGDTLTYGIVDPVTGELVGQLETEYGTVVVDPATGAYTFTPNDNAATLDDNQSASDAFQVAASDGTSISEPQNVSVTITGSNDGPVVETATTSLNLNEDGSAQGAITGSDVDAGDTVSYYLVDENGDRVTTLATENGSVTIDSATGQYTFTAADGLNSLNDGDSVTDSFQVVAWDGTAASAPQDVSVTINGSDDATVVTGSVDLGAVDEDPGVITIAASDLLANASDVDNALSVDNVKINGVELVDNGDGTYSYTPPANFNGTIDVSYDVVTDDGIATPATASIDVTAVDDATVVTGPVDLNDVAEDSGAITINASDLLANASDVDNALSVDNVKINGVELVDNGDGTYSYTPPADFNGTIDVSYDVVTDTGIATPATASIDVTAVEDTARLDSPTEIDMTVGQDGVGRGDLDASDPDGDTLTYGIVDPVTGELVGQLETEYGTVVVDPATGAYTFTPNDNAATLDDNQSASDAFQVAASDGTSISEPQNVSVTITGSNDGPVVETTTTSLNLNEDGSAQGAITGSDVDAGDTVSYYLVDENGDRVTTLATENGSVTIDSATGQYTFTAADGLNSLNDGDSVTDSFQVVAWDGTAASAPQDVSVTINGSDDATVVTGSVDLGAVDEDPGVITIAASDLLANASDVDNALSVDNVKINGVELVDNGDGTYSYTPPANFNGTIDVSYDVVTDDGVATPATASIDVTAVEDEAVITTTGGSGVESTTDAASVVTGTISATDADGAVAMEVVGQGEHGAVVLNADGTYTFTATDNDWSGSDTFTVRTTDANGGVTEQQVTVNVAAQADGAAIDAQDASIDLGAGTNDTITGTGGADTLIGGSGDDLVNGGAGNDVIYGDSVGTSAGSYTTALDIDVSALDSSESLSSVTISGVPAGASLSAGTDNGDGTWTLSVEDLDGLQLTVTQVDADGFDLGVSVSTADGTDVELSSDSLHVSFTGNAVDGNDVLSGGAGDDTVFGGGGNDTISGGAGTDVLDGGAGNDVFTMAAGEDGTWGGGTGAKDVGDKTTSGTGDVVSVGSMNQLDDTVIGGEGVDTLVASSGNDAIFLDAASGGARLDGIEVIDAGSGNDVVDLTSNRFDYGNVTIDGGSGNDVLWSSAGDDTLIGGTGNDTLNAGAGDDVLQGGDGNDTIIVDKDESAGDVVDGGSGTDTLRVELTSGQYTEAVRDELLEFNAFASDPANAGQSFTFDSLGGLQVTNMEGLSVEVNGTPINLNSPPDVVEAAVIDQTATEDQAFALDVSDFFTDADIALGDSLTYGLTFLDADGNVIATPDWVEFDAATGQLSGTPDNSDVGAFQIQVTATDESGATATTEPFSVSVADVDNAAEISVTGGQGDESTTNAATVVTGQIEASDADGGIVSFAVVAGGDHHGSLSINPDGSFSFTAQDANWNGTDTFQVQLTDGEGNVYSQNLTITVDPTNDAPVVTMGVDLGTGAEDQRILINKSDLVENASDVDGDTLSAANISADHGTIIDNGNGTITFVPDANYNGEVTFSYTISDGHGGTAQGTATLDLTSVNDGPVVQDVSDDGVEDSAITGQLTATDADGGTLSWSLSDDGAPAHGAVVVNADGSYTYTPDDNWSGEDSFTVAVSDGQGGTTTQTVTVSVDAVADAPELSLSLGDGSAVTLDGDTDEVAITAANMNAADSGFRVSAVNLDGSTGTLIHDEHGFGVAGSASGANVEIGQSGGNSEKIVVDFDSDVSSAQVSFGWLAPNEQAHFDLYRDGVKVGEGTVGGITDYVDPAISLTAADGGGFDQIVFSAPGGGDNDYMVNSITFEVAEPGEQVVQYPLDVSTSLTDTDGSETLSAVTLTGLPDGAVILDAAGNAVGVDNGDGTWTLPAGDLDTLTLQVPVGTDSFTLGATVTSTEADTGATVQTATNSVTVNVDEFNVGPTSSAVDLGAGLEDTAIVISKADLLANASDANGDTLSAANISADHGTIVDNGDGTVTFTPTADYHGEVTFTYTISDGQGGSTTGTATLDLADVSDNRGPVAGDDSGVDTSAQGPSLSLDIGEAEVTRVVSERDFSVDGLGNLSPTTTTTINGDYSGAALGTSGADAVKITGSANAAINLGNSNDTLNLQGSNNGNSTIDAGSGNDTVKIGGSANAAVNLGSGDDSLQIVGSNNGNATIDAGSGDDTVKLGGSNNAAISLGEGDDVLDVNGSNNASISAGSGDDAVTLAGAANAAIDLGQGADRLWVNGALNGGGTVDAGSGDDSVHVAGDANAKVILGEGDDQLRVTGNINGGSTLDGGSGNDYIEVGTSGNINSTILGGSGNDTISIGGGLNGGGYIDAGSGNDFVTVPGRNIWGTIDGGSGTDSIELTGYTKAEWLNNTNGIQNYVKNFENIKFSDGQVIGDASVFEDHANGNVTDTYEYPIEVTAGLNDTDGSETLSAVTLTNIPAGATVMLGDQVLTANQDGSYSVAVVSGQTVTLNVVSDGPLDLSRVTASVTATEANGGDTATTTQVGEGSKAGETDVDQGITATEDSTLVIDSADLLANDTDADGDTLTIVGVGDAAHGTVTLNPDGTISFTPDPDYSGPASFTYTVSDGHGGTDTATVTLDVSPTNDAPVITSVSGGTGVESTTDAATVVTGSIVASDEDSAALSFALADGGAPQHGALVLNADGTYSYTASDNDWSGTDTFTVAVSDGNGGITTQAVTITVTPDADAPVVSVSNLSINLSGEGGAQTVNGTAAGETLQGGAGDDVINAGDGNDMVIGDGAGTYTAALDISAALADTDGSESLGAITIGGVPAGASLSAGTDNGDGTWTLSASDLNGLTISAPEGQNFQLSVSTSASEGGNGDTASTTATLNVSFSGSAQGDDTLDGGAGNDSVLGGAGNDTLSGGTGSDLLDGGSGNDVLLASDDGDWSAGFVAQNVGDPTSAGPGDSSAIVGKNVSQDVFRGGEGTDTLVMGSGNDAIFLDDRYSASPTGGARVDGIESINAGMGDDVVDLTSTTMTYGNVTISGGSGNDQLWGNAGNDVIDGGRDDDSLFGGSGSDTLLGGSGNDTLDGGAGADSLSGGDGNDTAIAKGGQVSGDSYDGGDGIDTLRVELSGAQYSSAVRAELQEFQDFIQDPGNEGQTFHFDTLNMDVKDFETLVVKVDGQTISLNDPPVANDVATSANEDGSISGQLAATDANGDSLSWSLAADGGPGHGQLELNEDGTYTYTPNPNFNGTDTFTVQVSDGKGGMDTQKVTVTVGAVDDEAVATGTSATGYESTTDHATVVSGQIQATDVDGAIVGYSVVDGGSHNGTLSVDASGNYTFTANDADWSGSDSFTIRTTDAAGGTTDHTVSINVTGQADTPNLSVDLGEGQVSVIDNTAGRVITGTSNFDSLIGGSGNDTISGGSGGEDYMDGGKGNDTITGSEGSDNRLFGGAGNDTITGGNTVGDMIMGGAGNDVVDGKGGNDIYIFKVGDGNDVFHGGADSGTADYQGDKIVLMNADGVIKDASQFQITMTSGSYSTINNGGTLKFSSGAAGIITMSDGSTLTFDGVEKLELRDSFGFDDSTESMQIADRIGDTLTSPGGDANQFGSSGADTLWGGSGEDFASGGAGADYITGGDDTDILLGDAGNDSLYGGKDADILIGGSGNDYIDGGSGKTSGGDNTETDVAVFSGNRDQYSVTQNANGSFSVRDLVANRDGTDTVVSVEKFRFADGDVTSGNLLSTNPDGLGAGSTETVYALDITASLSDLDGSETMSTITISGVPEGVTFNAGTDLGNGVWEIGVGNLEDLSIRVPNEVTAGFNLQINATAIEGGGDTATTSVSVQVGQANDDSLDVTVDGRITQVTATTGADSDQLGASTNDVITGTSSNNTLYGGAGNDSINGAGGKDVVFGGSGNDTITDGGCDTNDTLYGGSGNDTVDAGSGNDLIYGDGASESSGYLYAQLEITGGVSDGSAATYSISGLAAGVTLMQGNTVLTANNGVYTLSNVDGLQLRIVDNGSVHAINMTVSATAADGSTASDSVTMNVDEFAGSAAGDGNDVLYGGAGNDTVYGGGGDDQLYGGAGADLLNGGSGNDVFHYNVDKVDGSRDADYADQGGAAQDGTDKVVDSNGLNDTLDTFIGGAGTDTLAMTDGNDAIWIGNVQGIEVIQAGAGNDVVDINDPNGTTYGNVTVDAGTGNDYVFTNDGNDLLIGGDGKDYLSGNAGNDTLLGGSGNDTLFGGAGNDTLDGGTGDDKMYGGDGADTFLFDFGDGHDTIDGGTGNWTDTLDLSDAVGQTFVVTTEGGQSWTVTVDGENHGTLNLGRDADGEVHLTNTNGETVIDFDNIEQIKW
jgi:large repetitive protein